MHKYREPVPVNLGTTRKWKKKKRRRRKANMSTMKKKMTQTLRRKTKRITKIKA